MENFVGVRLTIDPETKQWFDEHQEYNMSALARQFFQLFVSQPAPMLELLKIMKLNENDEAGPVGFVIEELEYAESER